MLGTPAARRNGPCFLAGWVLGLTVVSTIVLLVSGGAGATDGGEPATWVDVLKLVLGALLLLLAARQWRGRPHPGEAAELPPWMQSIHRFTAGRSPAPGGAPLRRHPQKPLV